MPAAKLDTARHRADLIEAEQLREAGEGDLIRVTQYEVDGKQWRMFRYRYVLSDGREMTYGGPLSGSSPRPSEMRSFDIREVYRRRRTGECEPLDPTKETIEGKVFVFDRVKVTTSDGREVIHSIGKPK